MKISALISSVITSLLMLSTMICGFWIQANNITDQSSFDFHMFCGIAAVIFSFATLILLVIRAKEKGK